MSWFERVSQNGKVFFQLFCFPYAGGNGHIFRDWPLHLPKKVHLYSLELPGRGRRIAEPLADRLPSIVNEIAEAIHHEIRGTYALFGHSMGAIIAFEVTRAMHGSNYRRPGHLFVAGCPAPQWPYKPRVISTLPHDQFIEEIRKLNGTPQEVIRNPELMNLLMPILKADFELIESYEYIIDDPLPCPITAYGALEDEYVPMEAVSAWKEQTSSTFIARALPGNHFFVHDHTFLRIFHHDINVVLSTIR